MGHGPLSATDRRRQAGHKRPRKPGSEEQDEGNGATKPLAHLFSDRRRGKNREGKRKF